MLFIKNGTIETMVGERISNGNVLVEDGKIIYIGTDPQPEELDDGDLEIIDAKGHLVMPGLIDAHCHIGITEEKKGMEGDDCNESVNPITPYLRAMDAINPMDAAFSDAIKAGITSAMTGPGSSNVVGGQWVFMKMYGRRIDDLIVKAPAAMKIAFGENPKVNYSGLSKMPSTRMAIAAMLREELFLAKQYWEKKKRAREEEEEFKEDFKYECWIPVFEKQIPLKAHVHRTDDIFTAIRIAEEFDLDITLDHCSEGHFIAKEILESGFPAIVGPDLSSRNKIEIQNMAFKTVGVLNKAGVKTAIITDHPVSLIQSLPICAGLAVKAGLPMSEGLKSITKYPAEICRVSNRVGTLEVGKDGDIAIFDGNPMEVFTQTLYTIIDGKVVYKKE